MKIIELDQEAIRNQAIRNSIPVPDDTWDAVKDKVMALLKKWKQWPIFFEEEAFKTHLARNKDVLDDETFCLFSREWQGGFHACNRSACLES